MALNEEKILSGKFIFISYSHKDGEIVKADMKALLRKNVRIWFDENMRLGDDWTEIAERTIRHENCVGAIFYNSANAFVSRAVQREQRIVRERVSTGAFKYWSVHIDGKFTDDICRDAMFSNPKDYSFDDMMPQREMFSEKILCIMRTDDATAIERIYSEIALPEGAVDNENSFIESVQKNRMASRDTGEITLGRYIDGEYNGPERAADGEDGRFGSTGRLIQLGGARYTTKPIRWKLMYVEDGKAVLLCTEIIAQTSYDRGQKFMNEVFAKVALSEEEMSRFGEIRPRYMTANDAEKAALAGGADALSLSKRGSLVHWWINEDGLTKNWKQTYSDDFRYEKGFSMFIKKGLRPVLEIPADKFR